ncbi:MAG: phytanoyl-CoA dioxygenase family protein, partial [Chloroflexi bacterium]|nr:phytanoyl-CoA dioxygenase family protein [Chloroflexota bacterium]
MTQTLSRTIPNEPSVRERMSDAQFDSYKRAFAADGYVVIKNVVPRDQLAELHAKIANEFERQKRTGELFAGGGQLSGHLNCYPGEAARFAYQALVDYGIVDLIEALSSRPLRQPNVGCNFNMPGSHAQQYHMDRTYRNEFMIANISVVDTDLVNGATDVVPGTHRRFYKYWQFVLERKAREHKRVISEAGDVLVRVSNLWHRGMPNHSSVPRPMLAFSWEDGGNQVEDPFAHEGGAIRFRPNWFAPTWKGRVIEKAFV